MCICWMACVWCVSDSVHRISSVRDVCARMHASRRHDLSRFRTTSLPDTIVCVSFAAHAVHGRVPTHRRRVGHTVQCATIAGSTTRGVCWHHNWIDHNAALHPITYVSWDAAHRQYRTHWWQVGEYLLGARRQCSWIPVVSLECICIVCSQIVGI